MNPDEAIHGGGLHPIGGEEITSGFKGYGLGMMVEIFCSILAGGDWGPHVRKWLSTEREANLGQCFVAIDPSGFAPGFTDRLQALMDTCRGLEQAEGETKPVIVHGDKARQALADLEARGGIAYHPNQIEHANELAAQLGVKPPDVKE